MRSGSKSPMIGPQPCAYACVYRDPVFTSQSYDISVSRTQEERTCPFFFCLMLMSTQFSPAYICACACACDYAYALMKTSLEDLMDVKHHRCAFSIHQNKKRASLYSREADRKISQNKRTNIEGKTNGV